MVYAFVIQTLVPGPCRLLYSAIYANETQQSTEKSQSEDLREVNKRFLLQVCCRIQSEYSFRCAVGGVKQHSNELMVTTSDELLSQMKSGVFRLYPNDPFSSEKHVIWKGVNNCGFAMICEKNENRVTAQNVLGIIIKFIQQHCDVIEKPSEVLLKPDKIEAVLHHFLPCGQLLFMNHHVVRQFEKDLGLTINNKT